MSFTVSNHNVLVRSLTPPPEWVGRSDFLVSTHNAASLPIHPPIHNSQPVFHPSPFSFFPSISPSHPPLLIPPLPLRYTDVLEPKGTVEIKFWSRELVKALKLGDPSLDAKKNDWEAQLLAREQALLPTHRSVGNT